MQCGDGCRRVGVLRAMSVRRSVASPVCRVQRLLYRGHAWLAAA